MSQTTQGSIAVLYGGRSPEREGSLISSAAACDALTELGWNVRPIDMFEHNLNSELSKNDCIFVASHGWYGEDGKLQGFCESLRIPYTGSGVFASACAMAKPMSQTMFHHHGIPTPAWHTVNRAQPEIETTTITQSFQFPVFVKPVSGGGSLGTALVHDSTQLLELLRKLAEDPTPGDYMVSQYVKGRELSVGIIEVDGENRVLPIAETSFVGEFYDYAAKHDPRSRRRVCPAPLSSALAKEVADHALRAFEAIDCHGVARVDFLLDADDVPWCLEINTVPGLSRNGSLATMAAADGIDYPGLIDLITKTAFSKNDYCW